MQEESSATIFGIWGAIFGRSARIVTSTWWG
jgi:hypothetical protein